MDLKALKQNFTTALLAEQTARDELRDVMRKAIMAEVDCLRAGYELDHAMGKTTEKTFRKVQRKIRFLHRNHDFITPFVNAPTDTSWRKLVLGF